MSKVEQEIEIFGKFVNSPDNPLRINKYEKRNPPEPDFYCELSDGKTIAFELTECIGKDDARLSNRIWKLIPLLKDYRDKKLPEEKKSKFKKKFNKTIIDIDFIDKISDNKIISKIPNIFDCLLTLNENYNGEINIKNFPDIRKIVSCITVSRLNENISSFDIRGANMEGNTIKEIINRKLDNDYKTKANIIELLVFLNDSYGFPENNWLSEVCLPDVKDLLEEKLKTSIFKRVWVYLINEDKILFVYPELK